MTSRLQALGAAGDPREAPARVLVVDDDLANLELLARRLSRRGHTVHTAPGGAQALAALERERELDCVLLDINMPGMDGFEVLGALRRAHTPSELPVIMVTALHDAGTVVLALERGANDYVTKPVDIPVLEARIRVHTRLRRAERELKGQQQRLEARVAERTGELELIRERLNSLIEHVPAVIYMKDREGRFQVVNQAFADIYGLVREAVLGATVRDFLSPALTERAEADDRRVLHTGEPYDGEWRLRHPDGTEHTYRVRKVALRDAAGAVTGLVGVNVDVTDERRLGEQLAQAQRLESLGRLTAGVAHDFNNLLTAVVGNLQLIAMSAGDDDKLASRVRAATDAAMRGADLTRRLLASGRRQLLMPGPHDVAALVRDAAASLQRAVGPAVEVVVGEPAGAAGTAIVRVDSSQLQSGLVNLALNARDAMPEGGTLRLAVACRQVSAPLETSPDRVEAGRYVVVEVSDQGTGIPRALHRQVVEPFFSTREPGKGSGLGLSMVYGFVHQSGGCLTIDSAGRQGTTVSLYLPAADGVDEAAGEGGGAGFQVA